MAFFMTNTSAEAAAKAETGSYINESGIYELTIKTASVSVSPKGSTAIDFNFEGPSGSCTVYGLRLNNNDGSENFQMAIFNSLAVVLGLESIEEPVIEEHKFGAKTVNLNVLQDLSGRTVKVWLQKEWSQYNNVIRGSLVIKRFYDAATGKTANEILNGLEASKLAKDLDLCKDDKYKDGLTKETAIATPKGQTAASTNTTAATPAANPFAAK